METTLKKDSIGLKETMLQGVASSAPAGAAVATLTGAAAFALGSLPLTAVIGFLVVFLNAIVINRISSKVSGAGGYYEYVKNGYGARAAMFTGLFYVFYQTMALTLIVLSIAVFLPAIFSIGFGISIPSIIWLPLLILALAFAFTVSYLGIKGSTGYTAIMALVEIIIIGALGAYIILSHPAINNVSVFTPKYAAGGFSGVGLGVLLMYTAFSGFGASTPLGEEARKPKKIIGRSVIFSVIILGAFFIFISYVFTVAQGPSNMITYAGEIVPGITILKSSVGPIAAIVVAALFINSLLTGAVVLVNGASRVMMAMGRDGLLPSGLSRISVRRKTPYISAAAITLASFVIGLIGVLTFGGFNAFLMAAIAATLGVLFVHAVINASLPRIEKKFDGRMTASGILLSAVTVVIFGLIFYSTFLQIEPYVVVGTGLFIAWLVFNFIYVFLVREKFSTINAAESA